MEDENQPTRERDLFPAFQISRWFDTCSPIFTMACKERLRASII